MKTKTLLGILAGMVTTCAVLENTGPVERDCEIYQGYTPEPSEGKVIYVFDPEEIYSRSGYAKHVAEGNPALADSLKRGNRYCFDVMDPLAPWVPYSKLESINPQIKVD